MIRTWTPESEEPKPQDSKARAVRAWFEQLPKMRQRIHQQQEHIEALRNAAETTTAGMSGLPGRSGTSDKVGSNVDAVLDAEKQLSALCREYAEMQKAAIDTAYLLHADPASIKRSRCITMCYVEGQTRAKAAKEVGYSDARTVSTAISDGFRQLSEIWEATPFCDSDDFAQ